MFVTDGEVDVCFAIGCSVKRTLHKMLLHGGTCSFGVLVEEQEALWQLSVVQALSLEHIGSDSLVAPFSDELFDALALVLLANGVECVIESELLDGVEVFLLEIGGGHVIVGIDKCKHVLEHTAGSARCGYELDHLLAFSLVGVPGIDELLALGFSGCNDTIADTSRCFQLQEGETSLELVQLILNLLRGDTLLCNLL